MVKVLSWYDNDEWGYSTRLVEMGIHIATK